MNESSSCRGSGRVATLVIPFLAKQHQLRIYDRNPVDQSQEFLQGELTDPVGLEKAVEGMDALIYLAMGAARDWDTWQGVDSGYYDVTVKGLHFLLRSAQAAGIQHVVYCSSMSVYADLRKALLSTRKFHQMKQNFMVSRNGLVRKFAAMPGEDGEFIRMLFASAILP